MLDGAVQLSERDEFLYHESLVHPAMILQREPKRILIVGGGDGGALRQVLRYPVEQVHLVELDAFVLKVCRNFLFSVHQNSFDHPKVKVFVEDGRKFLQTTQNIYDVIFLDLPDPVGPAESLAEREFFELIRTHLFGQGLMAMQAGSPFLRTEFFARWKNAVQSTFRYFLPYIEPVPTFPGGVWTFIIAGKEKIPQTPFSALPETLYWREELLPSLFRPPAFLLSSEKEGK